jgi:hypothetical protein
MERLERAVLEGRGQSVARVARQAKAALGGPCGRCRRAHATKYRTGIGGLCPDCWLGATVDQRWAQLDQEREEMRKGAGR